MFAGHMIGGFPTVASPASYGKWGMIAFSIDQDGVARQQHPGPKTEEAARAMTRFDPDPGWEPATTR